MIKDIVTDPERLAVPCKEVEEGDMIGDIITHLMDTAVYLAESGEVGCAGLAANQIGYNTRIFVAPINGRFIPFINPVIVKRFGGLESKTEGCLSVPGKRAKVKRHKRITLEFNDFRDGRRIQFNFKGFTARVLQHELDHLDGKTI